MNKFDVNMALGAAAAVAALVLCSFTAVAARADALPVLNVVRVLPVDSTALCRDGTASNDWNIGTACSVNGGVQRWLVTPTSNVLAVVPSPVGTLDRGIKPQITADALPPTAVLSAQAPATRPPSSISGTTGSTTEPAPISVPPNSNPESSGPFIPVSGNGGGPTQCGDGTVSYSSGSGTCSGHGGVAQ